MPYLHFQSRSGLSLVEVVISSMLVGIVVVGSLEMLGASVDTQRTTNEFLEGPFLADSLLTEIMSKPYADPDDNSTSNSTNGTESSVTRADFDDVGDYNGWAPTDVQDSQGNALTKFAGWSRAVSVQWASRLDGSPWILYNTGLKRIVVTVTAPDGTVTSRFGLRAKDGALEQQPTVDITAITQIESALSIGSSINEACAAINLLNHVEDPND